MLRPRPLFALTGRVGFFRESIFGKSVSAREEVAEPRDPTALTPVSESGALISRSIFEIDRTDRPARGFGIAGWGSGIAGWGSGSATQGSGIAGWGSGSATQDPGIAGWGSGSATQGSGIAGWGSGSATRDPGIAGWGSGSATRDPGIAG
jgi:hypothetical protein